MPTIEDTLDDIIRRLDENVVIVSGIRGDTDIAFDRSNQAIADLADTRIYVISYTDTRIQEVYDYFNLTLSEWAESIDTAIKDYIEIRGNDWRTELEGDISDWRQEMIGVQDQILADYEELQDWVDETFDELIPGIEEEIAEYREELDQTNQTILNEIGRARQEAAEMANRWRGYGDQIEDHKARIIEMDYTLFDVKDELHRSLAVEFDGRFANYDERIVTAAGEIGAITSKVETLEVSQGDQFSLIQNVEAAMILGQEQIATQIQSLSVGTNTQFDPAHIWHFDTTTEGWSGTAVDGFLQFTGTAQSPNNLGIDGNKYRQLRYRIRRVGNPTWEGRHGWLDMSGNWTVSILSEPVWAGDYAEVTWNPTWFGTIRRVSLNIDLDADSDQDNYYEFDWITIGRPAPGASSADIVTERQARIDDVSAVASRIDAIDLQLTTGDGVVGVATGITEGLRSSIVEDAITGAVTAMNEEILLFTTRIDDLETGTAILSTTLSGVTNRVDYAEDEIIAVNSRIDNFQVDIDGIIQADAFQALIQRIEDTEDGITVTNQAVTSLSGSVSEFEGDINVANALAQDAMNRAGEKGRVFVQNAAPPAAERLPQNLWIDTTAGANTPKRWNGTIWEAVTDQVARDAAAAAASALAGLGDKADSSAVASLTQRVIDTEQGIITSAEDIVNLSASVVTVGGTADQAQTAAQNAVTAAGSKGKVFFQNGAPSVAERLAQNLWIDTTNGNNTPKRWNGSAWVAVTDKVATDAAASATAALNQLGGKADATAVNNLTVRVTTNENGVAAIASEMSSMGVSISIADDKAIAAQQAAENANLAAQNKGKIIYQSATPAVADRHVNNLWIDTTNGNNTPKRWNGSSWITVTDAAATAAQTSANTALTNAQNALNEAGEKGRVFFQNGAPPIAQRLAQNLWIDTTGGANTPKRWNGSAWVAVTDVAAVNAANAASDAMDLANTKGKVFYQSSAPPVSERLPQNLWIDTVLQSGVPRNRPRRWNGSSWEIVTDKVALDALQAANNAASLAGTKADASDFNTLRSAVNHSSTGLAATGTQLTQLTQRINNSNTGLDAKTTQINTLNGKVATAENNISAISNSLNSITSEVNGMMAGGVIRMTTTATPAGASSRVSIFAVANSSAANSTQTAGMFIEAGTDGINQVTFRADRFAIVQGSAATATKQVPFFVQGGNVYIESAFIQNLSVGRLKIGNNSITTLTTNVITGFTKSSAGWENIGSLTFTIDSANTSLVYGWNINGFIGSANNAEIRLLFNGTEITGTIENIQGNMGDRTPNFNINATKARNIGSGSHQLRAQMRILGSIPSQFISAYRIDRLELYAFSAYK